MHHKEHSLNLEEDLEEDVLNQEQIQQKKAPGKKY